MNTDTDCAPAAELARWFVPGPLEPDALAAALKVARTVAAGDTTHDVYTLFDTLNESYGTDFDRDQFAQIARAVLHSIVGIGALEVRDPMRGLQLWQTKNRGTTLGWAIGETISLISPADRAKVKQVRAARNGAV
jgi:hypothetical protein